MLNMLNYGSGFRSFFVKFILFGLIFFFVSTGSLFVWAVNLPIPDFNAYFSDINQKVSTKIYDRTGQVLLYDVHGTVRRTLVPFAKISPYLKEATISIEDEGFYQHSGIKITSMIRALLVDIGSGQVKQGGSTITQQVVKNALLNRDKTIIRKIKEVILALKLERSRSKDDILALYLNEIPYGGNLYGVEEAARAFFKKEAADLTLGEAAYVAAIPQAPTYYSPYGNHRDKLDERKNLVLTKMAEQKYITKEQAEETKKEKVVFAPPQSGSLKAPHFVFFIKDYLEQKYGQDAVESGGLKVTTTLDWDMQQKAEAVVTKYGDVNAKNNNAHNAGMVAMDPTTGQILVMVGSRDYYNISNEGNFNVTTAHRQPGSSFKPFVYATAFNKGYTPETTVFDLPTEFNAKCSPAGNIKDKPNYCYMPINYDDKYVGPISLRNALAQSRNVPSVKVLYLAGIKDSIETAQKVGITSLKDSNTYGLTLVLGGGEVSLLEMTSAYGVFATEGERNPSVGILRVEDRGGKVLEEFATSSESVLPTNTARQISNILSDNAARIPTFGANSPLYFPSYDVAAKTGTTNNYKDAWIIGYTPNLVVGAWAGNNDNTSMGKKVAGYVIAPMWNAFMNEVLPSRPTVNFTPPQTTQTNKPVLRGIWQGGQGYIIDKTTGKLATEYTPDNQKEERAVMSVHTILYWLNKNDPLGPPSGNPGGDPQFSNWEYPVRLWAITNNYTDQTAEIIPKDYDNAHSPDNLPRTSFTSPNPAITYGSNDNVDITINISSSKYPITKVDFYLNGSLLGTVNSPPYYYSLTPKNITGIKNQNNLLGVVYDNVGNKVEIRSTLNVNSG